MTKKDDVEVTIINAFLPKGSDIPDHVHEIYDISHAISGKATIWIDGIGVMKLDPGVSVKEPPGIPHKVYNVFEDLNVFDFLSGTIL